METPTNQTLPRQYRQRFSEREDYRNAVWRVLCHDFFSRYIPRNARLLDLGAGWGEFTRHIAAGKKFALDLNPEVRERVGNEAEAFQQDSSAPWPLKPGSLDVIFTSNFLEHLPSKDLLEKTLDEARQALKEKGLLICLGPNLKAVGNAYWDIWDHYLPITDRSLEEILTVKGFRVVKKIARFLPYSMSLQTPPPVLFLRVYLKLPFLWPLFGKQFLFIVEKT